MKINYLKFQMDVVMNAFSDLISEKTNLKFMNMRIEFKHASLRLDRLFLLFNIKRCFVNKD
jgi:hypothetical protein